jgi:hypothetical protein
MQQAGPPAWFIALAAGLLVMEACRMGMRLAAAKLWPPA